MESSIIFIGEKLREREWRITREPDFYDAILLSHQSPQKARAAANPYQSIPLRSANIAFNLCDHHIYFTYHHQTLLIAKEGTEPTEEEIFDVFHNLLLKEGNRVSYLVQMPKGKTSLVKRKTIRVLAEAKKLTAQTKTNEQPVK